MCSVDFKPAGYRGDNKPSHSDSIKKISFESNVQADPQFLMDKLPSPDDIKQQINSSRTITNSEEYFDSRLRKASIESEKEYVQLLGLSEHYKHKRWWSYFLMGMMFIMISFQCYLLYMVGVNTWNYEKYTWLLPALLVQNLAQIVSLAVFVVKSLFKDIS